MRLRDVFFPYKLQCDSPKGRRKQLLIFSNFGCNCGTRRLASLLRNMSAVGRIGRWNTMLVQIDDKSSVQNLNLVTVFFLLLKRKPLVSVFSNLIALARALSKTHLLLSQYRSCPLSTITKAPCIRLESWGYVLSNFTMGQLNLRMLLTLQSYNWLFFYQFIVCFQPHLYRKFVLKKYLAATAPASPPP